MPVLSPRLFIPLLVAALVAALPLSASEPPRELEWDDLMPPDWDPLAQLKALKEKSGGVLVDGSPEADEIMRQFVTAGRSAPVVPALDGQAVKLPGFVVPLDFEGKDLSEFLLVPYFGACIHVPPPPANQIVYVKTAKAHEIEQLYEPVMVTGTLRTEAHLNEMGDAGYTLDAVAIEPYEQQ